VKTSESIDTLAPALVKAQAAMPKIKKDSTNPHFKSSYLSLEGLLEHTRAALASNGFAIVQGCVDSDDGGMTVVTRLIHQSGQWIEGGVRLPLEKPSPQAAGSAFSYGKRYSLEGVLGLTGSDDDDANTAEVHSLNKPPAREYQPRPSAVLPGGSMPAKSVASRPHSNGNGPKMPFGRTKGTPLSDLKDEDIQSALDWAIDKGKFTEFQAEARQELDRRSAPVGPAFDEVPEALRDDDDGSLPF
jgi:hypothetical protein